MPARNQNAWASSTTDAAAGNRAWGLGLGIGRIRNSNKNGTAQVWPVRGGNKVPVDVKPGSCPNPINLKNQGRIPVAILGTFDLDVSTIDVATLRLEGVAPIHSSIEDVGTPFSYLSGKSDCDEDCNDDGPDGLDDLALKFLAQDLVAALGDPGHGECLVLTLTGNLKAEYGATPIEGEDVVAILKPANSGGNNRNLDAFEEKRRKNRKREGAVEIQQVDPR